MEYTKEQTANFIAERNAKRNEERANKKNKTFIWDSKKDGNFVGSVQKDLIEKDIVVKKVLSEDEEIEQSKFKQ